MIRTIFSVAMLGRISFKVVLAMTRLIIQIPMSASRLILIPDLAVLATLRAIYSRILKPLLVQLSMIHLLDLKPMNSLTVGWVLTSYRVGSGQIAIISALIPAMIRSLRSGMQRI